MEDNIFVCGGGKRWRCRILGRNKGMGYNNNDGDMVREGRSWKWDSLKNLTGERRQQKKKE